MGGIERLEPHVDRPAEKDVRPSLDRWFVAASSDVHSLEQQRFSDVRIVVVGGAQTQVRERI